MSSILILSFSSLDQLDLHIASFDISLDPPDIFMNEMINFDLKIRSYKTGSGKESFEIVTS